MKLSIPVPRCLSNHIRLKISPPNTPKKASSSLASLSSADEDGGTWDLTSDPHVTRNASGRLSRTHSYNNFADDESSDASTSAGFPDGCGIQGSFPSTERIRIRWARPMKPNEQPQTSDGRRRVGIREVKGDMSCTVLGASKGKDRDRSEGIVMRVQYEATCKGIFFPGVATLLGFDVGLDAGDCDVTWVPGMESKWSISGGVGFTGYAVGPPPTPPLSRQSSVENPSIYVLPSSPDSRGIVNGRPVRHDSSSSTSSLLRAPLPAQNVPDYSFESSPASTPISSLASLPLPSSPERDRRSRASSMNGRYMDMDTDNDDDENAARPPKVPITIHLNMNDLLPPSRHDLKFSISGTVLVKPRTPVLRRYNSSPNASLNPSDNEEESGVLVVPRFRVLHGDREYTSCTVRNDATDATLDVYNSHGSIHDAQTRKTVLQRGGSIKCGHDTVRVALRSIKRSQSPPRGRDASMDVSHSRLSRSRPRTPNGDSHRGNRDISPSMLRQSFFASTLRTPIRRDGPLMIPHVSTTITPLLSSSAPPKYAVRVNLPAPSDEDMEWLEFGLALPHTQSDAASRSSPKVEVASASIEGVPVRVLTGAAVKPEANGSSMPFGEASGKDWITWVKVHVGDAGGGKVEVLYLVTAADASSDEKSKTWALRPAVLNTLLPTFPLPVGEFEVNIPAQTGMVVLLVFLCGSLRYRVAGYDVVLSETNLAHEQTSAAGLKMVHYSMVDFFYPRLVLTFVPSSSAISPARLRAVWSWPQLLIAVLLTITCLFLFINLRQTQAQLAEALRSANSIARDSPPDIPIREHDAVQTVTITSTATVTAGANPSRWYHSAQQSHQQSAAIPADEAAPPSPSPPSDAPTPTAVTQLPTITPTPLGAPDSEKSLVQSYFSFPSFRSLRLEFSSIEFPEIRLPKSANATLHSLLASIGVVYNLYQKLVNYPLDPP